MTAYPRAVSRFGLAAWQGHDRAETEPPPHPVPSPVPDAWPRPPARANRFRLISIAVPNPRLFVATPESPDSAPSLNRP